MLYLVATPIGNLGDLTSRAAEVLRTVPVVACEDTRVTRKLLTHLGASPRLVSVREANEARASAEVLRHLVAGKDVAYCSDAGMPCVSDPGRRLVESVRAAGFEITALPGPSAVTTALALSGLPADRFLFCGFLPAKAKARREALRIIAGAQATLVLFEAPHRAADFLADALAALGPRRAAVCRELTKKHEEVITGTLEELAAPREWRGELTIVIESAPAPAPQPSGDLDSWLSEALAQPGARPAEVAKTAAALFDRPRNEVYRRVLEFAAGKNR